ncbi:GNAT family N-acetyltransferase [Streptomyces sp. XM4193]|uniref:GNAT family N-acetyltransferase n=1 Tax=Streptomyces sp. XM4193 TaxID=2929782 RepID=UPI001FF93DE0|nr:GNAT family N-acetyltransferase [Streptomyces sp. XM4193]MCK1794944.1 GNAT family N-acetyltransferase [Streptomyces sp. XM4193]
MQPSTVNGPDALTLRTAHTSEVSGDELAAAHAMVASTFDEEFSAHDWEHALGGMHVLVHDGAETVGHAAVVQRRLLHGGRPLRTGYVEGVGVHRQYQRRGIGGMLMAEIERIITAAYDLGALGATDAGAPLYRARGWLPWQGTAAAFTPDGIVPTPDDAEFIHVFPVEGQPLDRTGELVCDWRSGDVW